MMIVGAVVRQGVVTLGLHRLHVMHQVIDGKKKSKLLASGWSNRGQIIFVFSDQQVVC